MGGELDLIRSVSFINAYSGCEDAEVKYSDYRLVEMLRAQHQEGSQPWIAPWLLSLAVPSHLDLQNTKSPFGVAQTKAVGSVWVGRLRRRCFLRQEPFRGFIFLTQSTVPGIDVSFPLHSMGKMTSLLSSPVSLLSRLIFGTLYPAYYSYKAVKSKDIKEYVSTVSSGVG